MSTAIIIPTRGRSNHLSSLLENINKTAQSPYKVYFIVDNDDNNTLDKLEEIKSDQFVVLPVERNDRTPKNYNYAYLKSTEPFIMIGADDLEFIDGWLKEAIERIGNHGVLAFADRYSEGWGHFLIKREYIEKYSGVCDEPNKIFHEYRHEFADSEFQMTARSRKQIIYTNIEIMHKNPKRLGMLVEGKAIDATFTLQHPYLDYYEIKKVEKFKEHIEVTMTPKNPIVWDETYKYNSNPKNTQDDKLEFVERSRKWGGQIEENIFKKDAE